MRQVLIKLNVIDIIEQNLQSYSSFLGHLFFRSQEY